MTADQLREARVRIDWHPSLSAPWSQQLRPYGCLASLWEGPCHYGSTKGISGGAQLKSANPLLIAVLQYASTSHGRAAKR